MHCENCGTLVTGKEEKCPACGMSIKNQIARKKAKLQQTTQIPIVKEKKKDNLDTMRIIGYALLIIGILLIALAIFMLNKKEPELDFGEKEITVIENAHQYKGYQFIIPSEYKTTITDKYGMMIKKKDMIYTIEIDENNGFENYKNDYEIYYKDMVKKEESLNNIFVKEEEREYILDPLKNGENQAAFYATTHKKYSTFVGMIVKKEYKEVTKQDLQELTSILEKATLVEEPTEIYNDSTDIIMYSFEPNDFLFD